MRILKSPVFEKWYRKLDMTLKTIVDVRLTRVLIDQNFGDYKRIDNIYELRFKNGIRVYYGKINDQLVLLLNGGSKNTKRDQNRDIQKAKAIFEEYRDEQ